MSVAVRPAVESDIDEMSNAMAGDVSPEQLANRWQEHIAGHRVVLVALLDNDVAGTVSMDGHNHQRPDSLRLFALDVASALRRRGAGSALVHAVEREAGLRGLGHVNLEVASRKRRSRAALREAWVPAGRAANRRPLAASYA
jgi:ribosomal protein S18 acetylase RimI-like enzyme